MSTHKIVLLFQHGLGHPGNKSSHVVFLGDMNMLFTTGFSRMNERQVAIWDVVRNFKHFLLKKITIAFVTRVGQRKNLRYHRNSQNHHRVFGTVHLEDFCGRVAEHQSTEN